MMSTTRWYPQATATPRAVIPCLGSRHLSASANDAACVASSTTSARSFCTHQSPLSVYVNSDITMQRVWHPPQHRQDHSAHTNHHYQCMSTVISRRSMYGILQNIGKIILNIQITVIIACQELCHPVARRDHSPDCDHCSYNQKKDNPQHWQHYSAHPIHPAQPIRLIDVC